MRYTFDPSLMAQLRGIQPAPLDLHDEDEGIPADLHRVYRAGDQDWFNLLVRAGDSTKDGDSVYTNFIASTASVDRMGDIVEQSWRLAAWRSNPVILYEHAPPVVGRGSGKVSRESGTLEIKVQWDIGEHNPIGTLAGMQHLHGFRRAGSVGFLPGKAISRADLPDDDERSVPKDTPRWRAGHVFRFNELLEFSSVAVPANREAVQMGLASRAAADLAEHAKSATDPEEQIKRFVRESLDSHSTEMVLCALKDPKIRSAVLAMVWGDPQPTPGKPADPLSHLFDK